MSSESEHEATGAEVASPADPVEEKKPQREWEKVVPIEDLSSGVLQEDPGTPLLQAARDHDIDRLKMLVTLGDDVNAQHKTGDLMGMTALHWLAGDNYPEAVQFLIDNGANIKARDAWGQTALHHAAGSGNVEVMKILVASGLDIADKDDAFGQDAIHWAANKDRVEAVTWLLDNGADINSVDSDGQLTPMHLAANMGGVETVKLLHARGANLDPKDKAKKTPAMLAAQQGHPEALKYLLDAGTDVTHKTQDAQSLVAYANKPEVKAVFEAFVKERKSQKNDLKRLYAEGVHEWDPSEVKQWLHIQKLDKLAEDFASQGVDGPKLLKEGGGLVADEALRESFTSKLSAANRYHERYLEGKHAQTQWNMAMSGFTTLVLAFLIMRFFRRLMG